jgi:cytochrome c oxidase subunit IV
MSTETVSSDVGHQGEPLGGEAHDHPEQVHAHGVKQYYVVAVILAVLTAFEIWAGETDILGPAKVPALIIMMIVKFIIVVLYFMHLKFDAKIFGRLFWTGVVLAIAVYVAALMTFHFFG